MFGQINIDPGMFAQFGAVGVMLLWFMFRFEKKMDAHTEAITDLSRCHLLDILSRDQVTERVRQEADEILARVNQRATRGAHRRRIPEPAPL